MTAAAGPSSVQYFPEGRRSVTAATIAVITTCVVLGAGCGSSAAQHPAAHDSTSAIATHAVTPSPVVDDAASANERTVVNWLAADSPEGSSPASAISGPVMRDYLQFEALWGEALAAAGQPLTSETVSTIPGGYQLCGTSNGSTACDSFTDWKTGAQDRITDLAVDGQLIAPRLAAGQPAAGSQLAVSDVLAYRPGGLGEVYVAYKVRNTSGQVFGNGNPAWLAVFDTSGGAEFQEDENNSVIPDNLQPGESAVELVGFATRTVTGQFTLRSNDQLETVLATSALRTP
jgi:hypothetical protein